MLRRIFTQNLGTKAAAIILALVVWFYTNEKLTCEATYRVPVRFIPPSGFEVVSVEANGNSVSDVEIRIQGPRAVVKDIVGKGPETTIRVNASARELIANPVREIPLSKDNLNLPPEVVLKEVKPPAVRVVLEQLMTHTLKVDVRGSIRGELPSGYQFEIRTTRPSEVEVRGPQSVISNRTSIPVASIDISGRVASFSLNARVVPSIDGKPIHCDQEVYVEIEVVPVPAEKSIGKKPIRIMVPPAFPFPVKIDEPSVEVTLKGPQDLLSKPGIENMVVPYVNLTEVYGDDIPKYTEGTPYALTLRYLLDKELQGKISVLPKDKSVTVTLEKPKGSGESGGTPE